ncbi:MULTISPECIES: hypothetical protein [unclassified Staphylococcus]|uniref:hypothetical protein n=1 Tax=unclassified Staphylococcus TaxID=91994 RepID=UPI0021D0BFB5|nr:MULTISPECIES: hypothetical protein [unclassified Staphylococcus]UXR77699.1 hypothetical protein MUA92_07435 [Staphylococcus sp. IVB6227]UXR81855.1 hypothetical protein MUA51_07125 [Staphylococcus sp. IVB6214]
MFSTILKGTESFYVAIATLIAGLLAYHYTTTNNHRQLIDSLDAKSGWRKSLFELAEKQDIVPEDVQILRTTLRFNYKDNAKTYFDIMTKIIILYCEAIEREERLIRFSVKIECKSQFDPRIIRLFARYLLADHWEKNLLNNQQKAEDELIKPYREINYDELFSLYKLLQVEYSDKTYVEIKDSLDNLVKDKNNYNWKNTVKKSNLYKNMKTSHKNLQKENELFIYTLQKFIEYSNEK